MDVIKHREIEEISSFEMEVLLALDLEERHHKLMMEIAEENQYRYDALFGTGKRGLKYEAGQVFIKAAKRLLEEPDVQEMLKQKYPGKHRWL